MLVSARKTSIGFDFNHLTVDKDEMNFVGNVVARDEQAALQTI